MRKFGTAVLTVVAVVLVVVAGVMALTSQEPTNDADASAAKANAQELAQRAIGKVRQRPGWDHIEVDKERTTRRWYALTLYYAWPGPGGRGNGTGYDEAESDTKAIARAVLAELVASGAKPSDDYITVLVDAWRRVKGETGKDVGEFWGYTAYYYASDQLVYKRKVGLFGY